MSNLEVLAGSPESESKWVLTVSHLNYKWKLHSSTLTGSMRESGQDNSTHGSRNWALEDISFEIFKGQITALLGPNGSGKSTLMKVVAGILPMKRPGCSGQVQYKGTDFLSIPSHLRAQRIAYVPADLRAEFPLIAYEAVSLGCTCQRWGLIARNSQEDQARIQWAMELALCWKLRNRNLSTLSGGERQLVAIACALIQGAKILFLDESMSKMDLNHQALIGRMLKDLAAQGWSILLVCHDMNLASEWADSGILLKEGQKVAQGSIYETVTQELLKLLYPGVDLVVGKSPASGAPKVFFGFSS